MSRWLIRIGTFCVVFGILLASPLADLLPVDLGSSSNSPENAGYFRAVPRDEEGVDLAIVILALGGVLLSLGLVAKGRGK